MDAGIMDKYVLNILLENGWDANRKVDISSWIDILSDEGYVINNYAFSVLQELGGIQIRVSGDKNHYGVCMHFNPIDAASGEYDRMEIFNDASNDELFPIGECFDWVIYVASNKMIYLGDWMSLSIAGDTIEEFLNNMFDPKFKLKEIYKNLE